MAQNKTDSPKNYPAIRRVLTYVLFANLAITIIKITIGTITGALSVTADGFHSLVDSSSNLIGLAAIRLASRPADEKHPYGYQRYETLGALAIGGLLLAAAWEIGSNVVRRILVGGTPELSLSALIIMALTLPVNIVIVLMETKAGEKYHSDILLADATDTKTDLIVTSSVILSLLGIWFGLPWLDIVTATGVILFILRAAFSILKNAAEWLADIEAADPDDIYEIALNVPGVYYVHHIRSRGTSDSAFVDLHAKVAPEMSTAQAHAIASEIEHQLTSKIPHIKEVLVHIEPAPPELVHPWDRISIELKQVADSMGLGYHNLHVHIDEHNSYIVELHLEIPGNKTLGEAHKLDKEFERRVKERWERIIRVITHLEPLSKTLFSPETNQDPTVRKRIEEILSTRFREVTIIEITTNHLDGHLGIILLLGMDAATPLTIVHNRIEEIERYLYQHIPALQHIIIHAEPVSTSAQPHQQPETNRQKPA